MADPFSSARRKLARAKIHIEDLKNRIITFEQSNPYEVVSEPDPDKPQEIVHKMRRTKPLPETSEIAGDAINNLREALDHTAYAVAFPPRRHCHFPFGSDAANFEISAQGNCKHVPQEIISLFRAFKPYKGGNDSLWALNQICRANKHTVLTSIGINSRWTGKFPFSRLEVLEGITEPFWMVYPPIMWDRSKQEVVLARGSPNNPHLQYEVSITTFVCFDDVEVVRGQEAVAVLDHLVGIVERILMATEAEARRIGLIA